MSCKSRWLTLVLRIVFIWLHNYFDIMQIHIFIRIECSTLGELETCNLYLYLRVICLFILIGWKSSPKWFNLCNAHLCLFELDCDLCIIYALATTVVWCTMTDQREKWMFIMADNRALIAAHQKLIKVMKLFSWISINGELTFACVREQVHRQPTIHLRNYRLWLLTYIYLLLNSRILG